jgi:hypothetical protein
MIVLGEIYLAVDAASAKERTRRRSPDQKCNILYAAAGRLHYADRLCWLLWRNGQH